MNRSRAKASNEKDIMQFIWESAVV